MQIRGQVVACHLSPGNYLRETDCFSTWLTRVIMGWDHTGSLTDTGWGM